MTSVNYKQDVYHFSSFIEKKHKKEEQNLLMVSFWTEVWLLRNIHNGTIIPSGQIQAKSMFFQLVRMGLSSLMQPHIVMSLIKWVSFYIKKCLMQLKKYRQPLQDIFCHRKTALLADKSYLLNPHFISHYSKFMSFSHSHIF